MLHLSASCRYFLYSGHTDMRKGFDSLCGIVKNQLGKDPLSGDVFVFINQKRSHIKLLLWEGDGYSVYYKRLEKGTYEIPVINPSDASVSLNYRSLSLMLQGVSLKKVKYRIRYQHQQLYC